MSKISKAFESHLATIASGSITKTNVIGIRRSLNNFERVNNGWSPNNVATITAQDVNKVESLLGYHKPRVTGELHDTGKAMLQSKRYRKQLSDVAEIVADIDHFKLVGFDYVGDRGEYSTPVYRAYDTKGQSFPFRVIPWQSGGNGPEIVSSNYW